VAGDVVQVGVLETEAEVEVDTVGVGVAEGIQVSVVAVGVVAMVVAAVAMAVAVEEGAAETSGEVVEVTLEVEEASTVVVEGVAGVVDLGNREGTWSIWSSFHFNLI
jgi:hypothetical protein